MKKQSFYDDWLASIGRIASSGIGSPIQVNGAVRGWPGTCYTAAGQAIITPSDQYGWEFLDAETQDEDMVVFARYFALGIMDSIQLARFRMKEVLISVSSLEVDPIESSPQAFRLAGREAGIKAVEIWAIMPPKFK